MNMTRLHTLLGALLFAGACTPAVEAPAPLAPLPSPRQVGWQQLETYAFVHFGLNTFNDSEWGYGDADPATFAPTRLDCDQWAATCRAAGLRGIILTAKHHDGFCLWPTRSTEYCIRNSPYREGRGDIVGELAAACRRHGLRMGLYLSPWDRNRADYGTPSYVDYYRGQLRELLTAYGDLFEVWFDGANGGDGWYGGACETRRIDSRTYYGYPAIYEMVEQLQPGAVLFGDGGPGCRWVGNERGEAGATNWSFVPSNTIYPGYPRYEELQYGYEQGDQWVAAECDVSIRPGWFYHAAEDARVKTVDQLTELYYRSVGRNATLLLNFPVTPEGLIHPLDSARAVAFHRRIRRELAHDLLEGTVPRVSETRGGAYGPQALTDGDPETFWSTSDGICSATVEFTLPRPERIDRLLLQEYIPLGQRVRSFVAEYDRDGQWVPIDPGEATTTVGYKRLLRFAPVETRRLRVRFLDARGPLCIHRIGAFCSTAAEPMSDASAAVTPQPDA